MNIIHQPVLTQEILNIILQFFAKNQAVLFIDGTTGEGGHSEFFFKEFSQSKGILLDRDKNMLEIAKKRLHSYQKQILYFQNSNFAKLKLSTGIKANFILADLGISSYHYKISQRGFGFQKEEELDMRLESENQNLTAQRIINFYPPHKLLHIFYEYGEESWSKKIVETIITHRKKNPIQSTFQLADLICRTIPKKFWKKNFHPATKIFQALRIEVNQELQHIQEGIPHLFEHLLENGLLFVISFHSLEDRIIKKYFKKLEQQYKLLTKKPIKPQKQEKINNPASRSAKLRVITKIKK